MENEITKIAAIDIGTTKIVAIVGFKKPNESYEITGFGTSSSSGINRGVVNNIEQTVNSINVAIKNAGLNISEDFDEVYVGVAGQHIRSIKNRAVYDFEDKKAVINELHVKKLLESMNDTALEPGEKILHVIPQSYNLDSEKGVLNPIGKEASLLQANYHIVIGQEALLNNIQTCLNSLNIEIKNMILEPLASASAVLTTEEKKKGVVLVDIGGGTTDIAIFKNNSLLHSAVIPIGGNTVTKDIKQSFTLLENQAEELKIQYGSAIKSKEQEDFIISLEGSKNRGAKEFSYNELCLTIQARMEEIIHAVMFQIESAKFYGELDAGIVITGGGSLLKNLKQLVSFVSKYDVRIAYPNKYVTGPFAESINKPQLSTAVGLIMEGYKCNLKEKQKIEEERIKDIENQEKPDTKLKKEGKFFDNIKNKLAGLFDDDDELN